MVEEGTPPGEIVVEVANPTCPAALRTTLGIEIHVSKSGYACVSTPEAKGWAPRRYLLERATGRKKLGLGREIFNERHRFSLEGPVAPWSVSDSFFRQAGKRLRLALT